MREVNKDYDDVKCCEVDVNTTRGDSSWEHVVYCPKCKTTYIYFENDMMGYHKPFTLHEKISKVD